MGYKQSGSTRKWVEPKITCLLNVLDLRDIGYHFYHIANMLRAVSLF